MNNYNCECCKFSTKSKYNFERHLKTNKHKNLAKSHHLVTQKSPFSHPKVTQKKSKKSNYICEHCGKIYKYKQGLYRHINNNCNKSKYEDMKKLVELLNEQNEEKDKENKEIKKQMEKMQKQINKLSTKLQIKNIKNITKQQNNTQNNYNINIQLLNYYKTYYSHLTEKDYIKCINDCNHCVKTLIEKVHFNESKPENNNIYISNIKNGYVMLYKDNKWQLVDRKEQINDLYDYNEIVLDTWFKTYKDKYPEMIKSFERYLKNIEEDNQIITKVKEQLLLMLYNNRLLVENEGNVTS